MAKKAFSLLSLPVLGSAQQVVNKFSFPINLTEGHYRDIELVFKDGDVQVLHKGRDTRKFSFVWLTSNWSSRDIAYALHLYLKSTKTQHSNVEKSPSKITDCMVFALNGISMPDTVFISRKTIKDNVALLKQVCGFPLIMKDAKGAQGKYSEIIANEAELVEKTRDLPVGKKFLFQRYIPNEYDWGIMVANGVVVAGEKSYPSDGEFRNNACNGAREVFVDVEEIPEDLKDMALKASKALGLSWSRADIIIDKKTGKSYMLEVNRYPGITAGSSEVSGAYKFLASHILPVGT